MHAMASGTQLFPAGSTHTDNHADVPRRLDVAAWNVWLVGCALMWAVAVFNLIALLLWSDQ
jgi:hypothetical protein